MLRGKGIFGCVCISFRSDTYRTSILSTIQNGVDVAEAEPVRKMSGCIKMGLFELLNSDWLIRCLKSQTAMMKLTVVSHFKVLSSIPKSYPQVIQIRAWVRCRPTHQVVRYRPLSRKRQCSRESRPKTHLVVMCATSKCTLRCPFRNLRVTNVTFIVTYYTLPPIESSDSFWMTRSQRSRRRDKGL